MSVAAMSWAAGVRGVSGTQKLVLMVLANRANAAGECWPSVPGLAADCCISERATRNALRELEAVGLVTTLAGGGRARQSIYRLAVTENPADGSETRHEAPPLPTAETRHVVPETRHVVPERGHVVPGKGHEVPPNRKEPKGTDRNRESARERRATRLPADWRPTDRDRAFAVERGLDPDALADGFRDYWRAKPKANTSLDWSANWRTWCSREVAWAAKARGPARQAAQPSKLAWMTEAMGRTAAAPAPSFDYEGAAEVVA